MDFVYRLLFPNEYESENNENNDDEGNKEDSNDFDNEENNNINKIFISNEMKKKNYIKFV